MSMLKLPITPRAPNAWEEDGRSEEQLALAECGGRQLLMEALTSISPGSGFRVKVKNTFIECEGESEDENGNSAVHETGAQTCTARFASPNGIQKSLLKAHSEDGDESSIHGPSQNELESATHEPGDAIDAISNLIARSRKLSQPISPPPACQAPKFREETLMPPPMCSPGRVGAQVLRQAFSGDLSPFSANESRANAAAERLPPVERTSTVTRVVPFAAAAQGARTVTAVIPTHHVVTQIVSPSGATPAIRVTTPIPAQMAATRLEATSVVVVPNPGSAAHGLMDEKGEPVCEPCAWFYKAQGCVNGATCGRCHFCPEGEIKVRKRMKRVKMRAGEGVSPLRTRATTSPKIDPSCSPHLSAASPGALSISSVPDLRPPSSIASSNSPRPCWADMDDDDSGDDPTQMARANQPRASSPKVLIPHHNAQEVSHRVRGLFGAQYR